MGGKPEMTMIHVVFLFEWRICVVKEMWVRPGSTGTPLTRF